MKNNFKWQYIYFLLAGLDLLVVFASLALSHHMAEKYSNVVNENLEWAQLQKNIDYSLKLAQEANAPGNDVFDSLRPKEESERVRIAREKFDKALATLKAEIIGNADKSKHPALLENFWGIESAMTDMIGESSLIFNYFEKGENEKAGSRMATMDRKYAMVQNAIGDLKAQTRSIQGDLFRKQQEEGALLKNVEFVFALFIVMMVIGISLYGRKMSRFVEEAQKNEFEQQKQIISQQAVLTENAKMSALGAMAGGIAHELNNPLSIIVGKATQTKERLKKGDLPKDKIIEAFEKIESVSGRMAKIIHGMRTFSRDATQDELRDESLKVLVDESMELCRDRLKKFDVSLEVSDFSSLKIPCRATQISQVLLNLIANSVDAISALPERWIKIEHRCERGFLFLTVTDSGKGIPEDIARNLMTPFFTTKEVGKGTGLGLSISKGILEKHNGSLTLNSKCPHTQFCLKLPLSNLSLIAERKAA